MAPSDPSRSEKLVADTAQNFQSLVEDSGMTDVTESTLLHIASLGALVNNAETISTQNVEKLTQVTKKVLRLPEDETE